MTSRRNRGKWRERGRGEGKGGEENGVKDEEMRGNGVSDEKGMARGPAEL